MSVLDNQKDFFIKEKLQKDKIISKKADDVFNNFFKGDFYMNQEEKNIETSKENTKVKSKKKYKKILATAASFFIIFGAANVYAMTQGYDNIFFMIKYLTTGDQSLVTNKEEILSDSDISISYEPIKITSDIRLQIKNLQIKDNEAKLFLVVNEDNYESNSDVVPLSYKVYNSENTLLCTQTSSKDFTFENTMYTEELALKNLKTTDKILRLEIYKNDSKLITKIKIDLDTRTIEVEGKLKL